MRKTFLASMLVILLAAASAPAQKASVKWYWATPDDEEFGILMPDYPYRVRRVLLFSERQKITPAVFELGFRGALYSVVSFNKNKEAAVVKTLDDFVNGFRYAVAHSSNSGDGSMTFEKDVSLDGATVKQYVLRAGGKNGTARVYETENHYYVVMTLGAKAGDFPAEYFFRSYTSNPKRERTVSEFAEVDFKSPSPPAPKPLWPVSGTGLVIGTGSPSGAKTTSGDAANSGTTQAIQGGVLNGQAMSKPAPEYPAIARAARAQGEVVVKVVVDEEGYVIVAQAESGHPLLQQGAVNAARRARFTPTLLDGRPVKVAGVITYKFVLM